MRVREMTNMSGYGRETKMRHSCELNFSGLSFKGVLASLARDGDGAKADDERAWLRDSLFPIGVFSFWWLIYFG
ncbi:hypothetical protein MTBLM1_60254 [Rhodospirillaceae bacterium LM-1]|nr:hypothetical protein MTBLM1_60254 [Rhodospirillaceae bacterium LM-1]